MKSRLQLLVVLLFIGIAGVIFLLSGKNSGENTELEIVEEITGSTKNDKQGSRLTVSEQVVSVVGEIRNEEILPNDNSLIFVHVCGAVKKEGVYKVKPDARVVDAILAAGGLTKQAASFGINQAEQLKDGIQIYVPTKKELAAQAKQNVSVHNFPQQGTGKPEDSSEQKVLKININAATKEELMQLNGVGAAKAELIITYRETNGGFKDITDIMKIKGIKQKFFDKIKDNICV